MSNSLRSLMAAAAVLASAGCALLKPGRAPYPTGAVFPVVEDGSVPFGGRPNGTLRTRGGKAFLTLRGGALLCLDISGKALDWRFEADGPVLQPPYPGMENVYIRDEKETVYAVGPDGALVWKRAVGERILTPIVEGGGRVHFGTEKGNLHSLSLDGKDERLFRAGGPVSSGPVVSDGSVIFASGDGAVHVHDLDGKAPRAIKPLGEVAGPLGAGEGLVFFGTSDRRLHGWKPGAPKPRWSVRLGGSPAAEPVVRDGKLFVLGTNSVLYCLRASGGDLLWWANVPSRSSFEPAFSGGRVIVASRSPVLLAFDASTGRKAGEYKAGWDLVANVVWSEPFLAAVRYDIAEDAGAVVLLSREIAVRLTSPKASPRSAGEEVPFTATAVGFHEPRFEFFIETAGTREVAQRASAKATWAWFAENEGAYTLGVVATDARQSREAKVAYVIEKRPERKAPEAPAKTKKEKRK